MDTQIDRPGRFFQWAVDTFGYIARDPKERTLRFLEEAIELGQAMDIDPEQVSSIIGRVYLREPGSPPKEIGQALATLELLAKAVDVDADAEATKEFYRVQSVPKEEWAKRHAAKVALGIAR